MHDECEETRRLVELEYRLIEEKITSGEDRRFKIKGWAMTVTAAVLTLGLKAEHPPWMFVAALFIAPSFGLVEAGYLKKQHALIARCEELERVMDSTRRGCRSPEAKDYVFGTRTAVATQPAARGIPLMFSSHSRAGLLYVMLIVAAIAGAAATLAGVGTTK